MGTAASFATFVCEQLSVAGEVSTRRMFGEYALYLDGIVVGLLCDGQLFVKKTAAAPTGDDALPEGPPYPGAKPYLIADALLDSPENLALLVRATAALVPSKKPARSRKNKARMD